MKKNLKSYLKEYKVYLLLFTLSGGISTAAIYNKEDILNILKDFKSSITSNLNNNYDSSEMIYFTSVEELKEKLNLETKNLEDVYNAIDNNKNIDSIYADIMKEQAYKLGETIDKEDYTILYYNIENLKDVEMVSKEEMIKRASTNTVGLFSSMNHEILLREDCNLKCTLAHETTHMYRTIAIEQGNDKYFYSFESEQNGKSIEEAITSKLTDGTSYKEYINYLNEFEKIIGKDKADEIFYCGTLSELKTEFNKLYNNENLFNKLILLIDMKLENEASISYNESLEEKERRLEKNVTISTEIDKILMVYKLIAYEKQIKENSNILSMFEDKLDDILMSNYYYMYYNDKVLGSDKTYKKTIENFQLEILNYYNNINGINDEIIGIKDENNLFNPIKLYNGSSTYVLSLNNGVITKTLIQRNNKNNLKKEIEQGFNVIDETVLCELAENNSFCEEINGIQLRCVDSNYIDNYNTFVKSKVYNKN